ncbi:CoA transferase [Kitasatospora sp. NPDC001159]
MNPLPTGPVATAPDLPLDGLEVVECASFVAGPSGCMALAQLGAQVIRVDPIGGGSDHNRWPVTPDGSSLYWTALNKYKRSVAVNLRSPQGRELVIALATRPGPGNGVFVDNGVGRGKLSYETLSTRRADMIHLHIQGHSDGRPAVDYTVNAEVGVATITGPESSAVPVNHVLPAWDLLAGMTAATGVLAALHRRALTGEGEYIELALSDVATAGVANLGWLAEAEQRGAERPRHGNHMYGSFGVDFAASDGGRVMVVALTEAQWQALQQVTATTETFQSMEQALGADLSQEKERYRLRETIAAILRPWFESRPLDVVAKELDEARVLWGPYRGMPEVVEAHRRAEEPTVVDWVEQPGIGRVVSARSPLRLGGAYGRTATAPLLGEHTEEVLCDLLGVTQAEIGRLLDEGVVALPAAHGR